MVSRRDWLASLAMAPLLARAADRSAPRTDRGAIVRGPRDRKRLALVFTGDQYAEGFATILDTLRPRRIKVACFVTGRFLRNPAFRPTIERARDEGHDLGPHSDEHLLYASWDRPPKLLVTRDQFLADLRANERALAPFLPKSGTFPYFLPPYEHYTEEIAAWSKEAGRTLINLTPGSLSHADYMEDDNPRFVTAARMVESVLDAERSDPGGLNGFLLLMHLGAGPRRTHDHLCDHLGSLLGALIGRGYEFVRVPDLLRQP